MTMESQSRDKISNLSVKDIMTESTLSVDSSATAHEAAKMMEDASVGSIMVMENNVPIGIITDRDFAIKVTAHAYPIDTPVKRIMSTPLIGIGPDESISIAADMMSIHHIRKLPVIHDDKVIGIITATDLVNQLA